MFNPQGRFLSRSTVPVLCCIGMSLDVTMVVLCSVIVIVLVVLMLVLILLIIAVVVVFGIACFSAMTVFLHVVLGGGCVMVTTGLLVIHDVVVVVVVVNMCLCSVRVVVVRGFRNVGCRRGRLLLSGR